MANRRAISVGARVNLKAINPDDEIYGIVEYIDGDAVTVRWIGRMGAKSRDIIDINDLYLKQGLRLREGYTRSLDRVLQVLGITRDRTDKRTKNHTTKSDEGGYTRGSDKRIAIDKLNGRHKW